MTEHPAPSSSSFLLIRCSLLGSSVRSPSSDTVGLVTFTSLTFDPRQSSSQKAHFSLAHMLPPLVGTQNWARSHPRAKGNENFRWSFKLFNTRSPVLFPGISARVVLGDTRGLGFVHSAWPVMFTLEATAGPALNARPHFNTTFKACDRILAKGIHSLLPYFSHVACDIKCICLLFFFN